MPSGGAVFEKAHETRMYLLGLAGSIRIVEPRELCDAMCGAARALLADHARTGDAAVDIELSSSSER